jgi:hypothetical protein
LFFWGVEMKSKRCSSLLLAMLIAVAAVGALPAAGQVQVTSTNPSAAPQGTTNLNVTISGNGFKRGAKAQWFVTGTTNPGGVTVNSTTFNGSSSLTANITVASGATLSGFDVLVTNTDGRTGKGTDLFTVTQQGTPIGCSTTGTPSGFSLVTQLNPVQANGAALITTGKLGNAIRVRPLDLNGDGITDSLAAFVASGSSRGTNPGTYVFFLDPATGQPQATNPVTGTAWQNPLQVLSGVRAIKAAAGDVNGDRIPDFAMGGIDGTAYLFVGRVSSATSANPYIPSYTAYQISPPPGAAGWSQSVAFGDVDGLGVDEVVIGASGSSKTGSLPGAFIFKYTTGGLSYVREISDPTGALGTGFGNAVAVGNIDGTGNDLVVGAATATTNGLVYVFPHPIQQSKYFTLTGPGPNFGRNLGIADVNLDGIPDLLIITGGIGSGGQALLYAGYVSSGSNYTNQLLPGQSNGWGDPNIDVGDMAAKGAIAIGAPNASSCSSIQGGQGALNLFASPFASSEPPNYIFETPSLVGSNQFQFGYSVGLAPGYPFIVIGEHFRDVGSTSMAGQVYVYRLN